MDYIQNFDLAPSENNQVFLDISFENGNPSPLPDVTASFIYLEADCGAEALTDEIQVESIVAVYDTNESEYEHSDIYLPYGNYKLIASAEGYADFESDSFAVSNESPVAQIPIAIGLQELQ